MIVSPPFTPTFSNNQWIGGLLFGIFLISYLSFLLLMVQTFLRTIPQVRKTAETQIELAYREMIPFLSREFQSIITDYIDDNRESLRQIAADSGNDVMVEVLVGEVMDALGERLEAEPIENGRQSAKQGAP